MKLTRFGAVVVKVILAAVIIAVIFVVLAHIPSGGPSRAAPGERFHVDGEHDAGQRPAGRLLLLQRPHPDRHAEHHPAEGVVGGDGRAARRVQRVGAGPGGYQVAAGVDDLGGA